MLADYTPKCIKDVPLSTLCPARHYCMRAREHLTPSRYLEYGQRPLNMHHSATRGGLGCPNEPTAYGLAYVATQG